MKHVRKRLTYANVMSSIAVFLVIGGATAYAARQLGKSSVGTRQLKRNAVTAAKIRKNAVVTAKIKKNAVTGAKIRNGSVNGNKVKNGSLTGADINGPSTPFSQVVTRIRATSPAALSSGAVYSFDNPTYTQSAGVDNQFIGALDVNFAASCTQPRSINAFLLLDAPKPSAPTPADAVGSASLLDTGSGSVDRRIEFTSSYTGMARFAPVADTQHTFSVYVSSVTCSSGSGITAKGAGVDVIGTK